MDDLSSDRREYLRAFIPAETAQKILTAGIAQERRVVTVLFCDIAGSTALGERLGPERFKVVMDQVLGRIIAAIARYEGTVAQVMGDGLLAFFGAPLAHEDDPERAVHAALDTRDAVARFSTEIEAAYGTPVQMRIGMNTGPVVLSKVTDVLEVAYNALGDTVNTAARLQGAATPGTILLSESTARLVGPLFDLRTVGPFTLKGKSEPVAAAEVVARRTVTGKPRGIAGLSSPLVGRDVELERFSESIQAVAEGRGQIVAIIGEAGIGKSRLVMEAMRASPQVRWLEGRCLSYAGALPYFPFVDLLREWLGVASRDPDAKVRIELRAALDRLFGRDAGKLYPYLATMLRVSLEGEAAARLADLSPESLQHQTFKVMRQWAAALCADRPLGFILDDLHWGDSTSLALLETLQEVTEEAPLLLVLLFRPEREHGCWRLNDLARQRFPHRHVEIVLRPLAPAATDQLVANLLTRPDFPQQMRELILQKAEGNPFFVEEVIRELIDAGVLVHEGEMWRATRPVTLLDIPDNVQGVLLARIDRLAEPVRRILQAASVIGRLFPLDTLRAMLQENGKVDAGIADLQRYDLLIERRRLPRPEYRFKHALTQEVAYSTLTDAERRRLHGALARALEGQYQSRVEDVYGLLAYHYDRADDLGEAIRYLVLAGDKARSEYADQEALRYYERAVELMKERGEGEAAAQTLMKAALAHHIAFDFPAADRAYQEAFAILNRVPPPPQAGAPSAVLRWSILEPAGCDVARDTDAPSGILALQVFEGLLVWSPDNNVGPGIARAWAISADGTRYRFTLHRGRTWSDGRPVTAHDFVWTWLRGMRGKSRQMFHDIRGARAYSEGLTGDPASVGVTALEDHTLEVELEGPRSYFPFILSHPTTLPQPRWAIEARPDDWDRPPHLVANGAFTIAEWELGKRLRLVANPQYRGPRTGNVREVVFSFDRLDDLSLFERGETDIQVFFRFERANFDRFGTHLHLDPPFRLLYIFFRTDRPPFNDRRLRLAFAHATDRRAISTLEPHHILLGDGGAVPPALPGHSPGIGVPFDPEAARQLLAEAGYPGGDGLGPFVIPTPGGIEAHLVEAAAQMWREVLGVRVTVAALPSAEFWALLERDPPPLCRIAWIADYPDPDDVLRVVFHSTSDQNHGRFKDQRLDRLVEEAQRITDQRRRMQLYHEADHLLVAEEAAIIPLGYTRTITLVQPWVKGWRHWGVPAVDLIVERQG